MATHAAAHSTPSMSNLSISPFGQSNHIDLTLDDDDSHHASAGLHADSLRRIQRPEPPPLPPRSTTFFDPIRSAVQQQQQQQQQQAIQSHTPRSSVNPPVFSPPQQQSFSSAYPPPQSRPGFPGPSNPHFYHPNSMRSQIPAPSPYSPPPIPRTLPLHTPTYSPYSTHLHDQVIDLTNSPSPPLSPRPHPSVPNTLSDDLPPKTPVCIGQLTVTALVLYPVHYIQSQDIAPPPDGDWVNVRLQYEHNPHKTGATETIHIKTPPTRDPSSDAPHGEAFGVVEQRVASHLGPMLGKGLIRLDAKVRRGQGNVSATETFILFLDLFFYPLAPYSALANACVHSQG